MRGSGELLFQVKSSALCIEDLVAFAKLLWAADFHGESKINKLPIASVEQLIKLKFCARIDSDTVLLNPHTAQLGSTPEERGQIRKRFLQLVGI
jgi:hypothetical protein